MKTMKSCTGWWAGFEEDVVPRWGDSKNEIGVEMYDA